MPISSIAIREAISEDIPFIQQIAFSTWPVAYSAILQKEQLDYMLDLFYQKDALLQQMRDGHHFIVATDDENVIGFASFNLIKPLTFKLQKLYVLPSEQKSGAGKLLLDAVIERIKLKGAQKLQLNVNRHNKAISFYEKMGFTIIQEDDINIGHDYYMNDYVMEKQL
jgi:ribosomal protein S18 acetylase RimI-like enzyme